MSIAATEPHCRIRCQSALQVLYLVPVALLILEGEALEEWPVCLMRSQWVFSEQQSSDGLY